MSIHGEPSLLNNPILRSFLTGYARHFVTAVGALIVNHAIASPEDVHSVIDPAIEIVVGVLIFLIGLSLSNLKDYWNRQKLVTAQASRGPVSEQQVEQTIKDGLAPSVLTPKSVAPPVIGSEQFKGTGPVKP